MHFPIGTNVHVYFLVVCVCVFVYQKNESECAVNKNTYSAVQKKGMKTMTVPD